MNRLETHKVMTFLNAEYRENITQERSAVWCEMLKDIPYETAFLAAKILIARVNKFAGLNDFLKAVAEITTPIEEKETWAEAWQKWVNVARSTGMYRIKEAEELYKKASPRGALVMSGSLKEWFILPVDEINTFRAQFRQRYEAIAARANHERVLPLEIKKALGYVEDKNKTINFKKDFHSTNEIIQQIIK